MNKHALHIALVTAFASYLPSAIAAPVNYEMNLKTSVGIVQIVGNSGRLWVSWRQEESPDG